MSVSVELRSDSVAIPVDDLVEVVGLTTTKPHQ